MLLNCGAGEKTFESPLDWKEIKPVNSKEINPEYSLVGLLLKKNLQYFGHLMQSADSLAKIWLTGKDTNAGKDWMQKKRVSEEEKVRKHH